MFKYSYTSDNSHINNMENNTNPTSIMDNLWDIYSKEQ